MPNEVAEAWLKVAKLAKELAEICKGIVKTAERQEKAWKELRQSKKEC